MFDLNTAVTAIAAAIITNLHTVESRQSFALRAEEQGLSTKDFISRLSWEQALSLQNMAPAVMNAEASPIPETESFAFSAIEVEGAQSDTPLAPAPSAVEQEVTTSTNTTTENASIVMDSDGLPWDARIHSSSKAFVSKGTWKMKRNVPTEMVQQVEAELRQLLAGPAAVLESSVAVAPLSSAPTASEGTQGLHPEGNAFSPKTVDMLATKGNAATSVAATAPPPSVGSSSITTFEQLMPAITGRGLSIPEVTAVVNALGLASLLELRSQPQHIPAVVAELGLNK